MVKTSRLFLGKIFIPKVIIDSRKVGLGGVGGLS